MNKLLLWHEGESHKCISIKVKLVRNFILLVVLFTFTAVSAAQTQPGGFLVPIDMDDPYKLDLSFINNLTGDMYGRKFVPEKSAIWHGAHINDDPDEHRVAILVETDTGQIVVPPVG